MLLETIKIIFWFNPLVYRLTNDLKEIHEFQADDCTLNQGIDATKYQLLIIQKCVGHQKFALANSFNHCQIKKRIAMMNKQKTSNSRRWKVATFLPLLALLLMAFGRTGEKVPEKVNVPEKIIAPPEIVRENQNDPSSRLIEIRKDGNYIDNKLCSPEEIVKKAQAWKKINNKKIHLLVDESIPYVRVDEVREALENAKVYGITQSAQNSDDIIYFMGDVTEMAKFTQGKWNDWMSSQLDHFFEGKYKSLEYKIAYSFIIDKNGKVRDGHITKACEYPEINAAFEKILAKIPDWEPAKRSGKRVSVYNRILCIHKVYK
jgi:biopolymer transport protein ExbD